MKMIINGKEVEKYLSKEAEKELDELEKKICNPCPLKKECKGKCLIRSA